MKLRRGYVFIQLTLWRCESHEEIFFWKGGVGIKWFLIWSCFSAWCRGKTRWRTSMAATALTTTVVFDAWVKIASGDTLTMSNSIHYLCYECVIWQRIFIVKKKGCCIDFFPFRYSFFCFFLDLTSETLHHNLQGKSILTIWIELQRHSLVLISLFVGEKIARISLY